MTSKNTFGKREAVAQPSPVREPSNRSSSGDKKFLFKFAVTFCRDCRFRLRVAAYRMARQAADGRRDRGPKVCNCARRAATLHTEAGPGRGSGGISPVKPTKLVAPISMRGSGRPTTI